MSKRAKACRSSHSSRSPLRALLRRAGRGDNGAYFQLVTVYFDLICEYLRLCNLDESALRQTSALLLREGWLHLPFFKRLSDWERFLAKSLMAAPVSATYCSDATPPRRLIELDPRMKFAVVGFDLENWDYRWLALALRVQPHELSSLLFDARCRLLGVDTQDLPPVIRSDFSLVFAALDGQLPPARQREATRKFCHCERTRSFKSRWLDYRCHLIEARQQMRLDPEERDRFLDGLCRDLVLEDMLRPSLLSPLRNLIAFGDLPASEGLAAGQDFRYGRS